MSEFEDLRNVEERKAEGKFPGYKGPVHGQYTPGKVSPPELPRRLQVAFRDGAAYWLDVPEGSILPCDSVMIAERERPMVVERTGILLPGAYFETKDAVPHKFGTFVQLIRKAGHNG